MEYYSSLAKRRRRENFSAASSSTTSTSKNPQNNDDEFHLGQSINNSSHTAHLRREEQLQKTVEKEAALLLASLHTHAIANPPETYGLSLCNEARKRRGSSESFNSKEMGSALKKKPITKKSFAQRIEDLRVYQDKHGHVKVSKKEDKSLNKFCYDIRRARNNPEKSNTIITDDRIASLDALGFDWSVRPREQAAKKSFEQRMNDLRAYKENHGHINVKESDDKSLYEFCINMRYTRNNPEKPSMTLSDDRIASLDALGFDWSMNSTKTKSFEQRIADLKAYKEKHGHVNVKKSDDKSLYGFCSTMIKARNNPEKSKTLINEERIASLEAVGFDWGSNKKQITFEQRIENLRAYKEKHGHVNVKQSDDSSLYKFCSHVRHTRNNQDSCKAALITDDRIASLDALGFVWNTDTKKKLFEQPIEELRRSYLSNE